MCRFSGNLEFSASWNLWVCNRPVQGLLHVSHFVQENRREIWWESGNDQLIDVSRHSPGGKKLHPKCLVKMLRRMAGFETSFSHTRQKPLRLSHLAHCVSLTCISSRLHMVIMNYESSGMERNDCRRGETKGTEEDLNSLIQGIHCSSFLVHHEDYPHILQQ